MSRGKKTFDKMSCQEKKCVEKMTRRKKLLEECRVGYFVGNLGDGIISCRENEVSGKCSAEKLSCRKNAVVKTSYYVCLPLLIKRLFVTQC